MERDEIKQTIRDIEAEIAKLSAPLKKLIAAAETLQGVLDDRSEGVHTGFKSPSKAASIAANHLREHRPGRPSRIDCDPELREFILERIDTTPFTALEAAIAEDFPPERRVRKSALHTWWHRTRGNTPDSLPR